MKKTIGIITFLAVIVFTFSACDNGNNSHTHEWGNWETISPTCTEDGYDIRTCVIDSSHTETKNIIIAIGHEWEWVITKAATETEAGIETEACTKCGETRDTRPIPIIPKSRMDNQPVSDLTWGGKVTVKSADLYLDADWEKMVANVVAALERGYNKPMTPSFLMVANKGEFADVFTVGNATEVVVVNSGRECEVKSDGKMYLKAGTVTTVDVQEGVWAMKNGEPYQSVAKVMPMNKKCFAVLNVV